MFAGFDFKTYDDHLATMRRWSDLRFAGFYLAHSAEDQRTSWSGHWHDLKDMGWFAWVLWVPFDEDTVERLMKGAALGQRHGDRAATRARQEQLESGAAIFLDIEKPLLAAGRDRDGAHSAYIKSWIETVRTAGYSPGVYCSRLDAVPFTRADFASLRPLVWPFAMTNETRARWDDATYQLTPALPDGWMVDTAADQNWAQKSQVIGCQYDKFNKDRDRKTMTWPDRNGRPDGKRDVDWNSCRIADPTHPLAARVMAICKREADGATLDIFSASTAEIEHVQVAAGESPGAGEPVTRSADIGPIPDAAVDGFDPEALAVVSVGDGRIDGFVLGQDGLVRTFWRTADESFQSHPSAVNESRKARGGSPLAAIARAPNCIDLLFVDDEQRLTSVWSDPRNPAWDQTLRTLESPQVAGGSNLVVLPSPNDAVQIDQTEAFFVQMEFDHRSWQPSFKAVNARRADPDGEWRSAPVTGLDGVAAASGIAAVRDDSGATHVLAQDRARTKLLHAVREPTAAAWRPMAVPTQPIPGEANPWWMRLYLVAFPDSMVFFGIASNGKFGVSTFHSGRWSPIALADAKYSTGRPLAFAKRGLDVIDIVGVSKEGEMVMRTLARQPGKQSVWSLVASNTPVGS